MPDPWPAILASVSKILTGRVPGQTEPNRYALDRANRIVRSVGKLAHALRVDQRPQRVDLVRIAALYTCVPMVTLGKNAGDGQIDPAELAADQLAALLSPTEVDLVVRMLSEYRGKTPGMAEAKLLADAVGLEDFGLVGLWNQTRAFHAAGKTLDQLVKTWKTQNEYGYWESRLRDSFHFELTRQWAKERLGQMQELYETMLREHLGEDLKVEAGV